MKAVVIPRYGRANVLEVRELPDPVPGAGEVRIAVEAAGLNFSEVSARQGLYPDAPKPPSVVGYEVSGTIDALGDGVTEFSPGDRVWAICRFGGHAELVCTRVSLVRRMPATLGFVQAAAIPVAYATAAMLTSSYGHVRENERVLIHMAAGGVGLAALQLCRRVRGVTIFGTASSAKHAFLKEQGLHHPIDYRSLDFEAEVRRLTAERGVHLILDPMGGRNWKKNYRLLAPLGRLMVFGLANATRPGTRSWPRVIAQVAQSPRWSPMGLANDNRAVMGLNLGHLFDDEEIIAAGLATLSALIEDGTIAPIIDQVFPFSRAAEAHLRIEDRQNVGKVVLVPDRAPTLREPPTAGGPA
jgi:NADPH:quinone reductase-like Zn-dependent oxidoreductase